MINELEEQYVAAQEALALIRENPKWFRFWRTSNSIKWGLRWLFRGLWRKKGTEQPKDTIKDIIQCGLILLDILKE